MEVSLYVGLYEGVAVWYDHEAGFLYYVCLHAYEI